jgi:protocatechuate 3,4-dioxygenase beta subunit
MITTENSMMKKMKQWLALALVSGLLAACGGGGGNPGSTGGGGGGGTTNPVVQTPTISVALVNSAGTASNTLSSVAPLTARATVKDKDGKVVPNALVTFASNAAPGGTPLVVFSPSAGTTLTDANGVATVTMRPASLVVSGAGTVTASSTVGGTAVSADANYSVGATSITLSSLRLSPASIGAYGSSVISVDVLSGTAKYTEQQMTVNFTSACATAGKATLAATAPTSNGTAQVVFRDQGCGNNDVITATLNSGAATPATASATLTVASPSAASVQFVGATPVSQSIVIKGEGGFGRTETATLTFKVVDIFGKPLAAQQVNFSKAAGVDVTINKASDSTDANGEVITTVNSGSTPTSFRITATLAANPTVSTISDSIVVTTGKPVQQAFSLSVGSPNVEGWTFDSGPVTPATTVSILVADQAGNPVPDGLPVVFQSNLASIGSSSKGACNTVNGGCSVDFRTQNPRTASPNFPVTPCNTGSSAAVSPDSTRVGLATICASTTDGVNTLFAKTGIFLSGSFADNVWFSDTASPTPVRLNGGEFDLGTVGANDSRVFTLQLNDINNNPMPAGTRVDISNPVNAAATGVSPAAVLNVFAGTGIDSNTIRVGSSHVVTVGSVQPKPCLTALNATFNVTITTPRNNVTSYPFKLRFSCP